MLHLSGYLLRRLALSAATLLVITCALYAAIRSLPGRPHTGTEDSGVAAEAGAAWPGAHALDSLPIGYLRWLADVAQLDLGASLTVEPGQPVASMLA